MADSRMTTEAVIDAIARERSRLKAAIEALGADASTLPLTDEGWTAKDVIAHLTHWATQVAFGLGAQVAPPPYMMAERRRRRAAGMSDAMPTGEESNALAVAHHRTRPLHDVRAEFDGLVDALIEQARLRTDDEMNATDAVPWAGQRPLWQFIGGTRSSIGRFTPRRSSGRLPGHGKGSITGLGPSSTALRLWAYNGAMTVITVSGSLGSGAREIAQAAAAEMRLEYVDQEIMVEAARQLGVRVADVESRDERKSSIGERLASVMRTLMERSAAAGAADPLGGGGLEMVLARTYGEAAELPEQGTGQLDDERYMKTLTSVIKGVAKRGDVVILGRGSQAILRDEPGVLHVYVAAPMEHRLVTLMQRDNITHQDAERRIKESDKNRQAFHRHYFKIEPDSPQLYDLGINAARIRIDVAAKMIALAARERSPRPG